MSNTNPSWGKNDPQGQQPQPGYGYPPPQGPGYAQPPAPPQGMSKGKKIGFWGCGGCLGVVVVGIIVAVAAAGGGGSSDNKASSSNNNGTLTSSDNGAHPPQKDVTFVPQSCTVDSTTNWPKAKVKVTNHSSKTSDYSIQVVFKDASGVRVSDGAAIPTNVKPGESTIETAQGLDEVHGKITCVIQSVDRYASAQN